MVSLRKHCADLQEHARVARIASQRSTTNENLSDHRLIQTYLDQTSLSFPKKISYQIGPKGVERSVFDIIPCVELIPISTH